MSCWAPPGNLLYSVVFSLLNFNQSEKRAYGGDRYFSRVRKYPEICGFMPVTVLQDEILTPGPGQIRAMIVTGCNPLRAYTNAEKMERAFRELELLVSVDLFLTEVGRLAHYVLPVCSPWCRFGSFVCRATESRNAAPFFRFN